MEIDYADLSDGEEDERESTSANHVMRHFFAMSLLFGLNHGCVAACVSLASSDLGADLGSFSTGTLYLMYTLSTLIFANAIIMGIVDYGVVDEEGNLKCDGSFRNSFVEYADVVFVYIFLIECILKITALGYCGHFSLKRIFGSRQAFGMKLARAGLFRIFGCHGAHCEGVL